MNNILEKIVAIARHDMQAEKWQKMYVSDKCFCGLSDNDVRIVNDIDTVCHIFNIEKSEKNNVISPFGLVEGIYHDILYEWMMSGVSWDMYWMQCMGVVLNLEKTNSPRSAYSIISRISPKKSFKVENDYDLPF